MAARTKKAWYRPRNVALLLSVGVLGWMGTCSYRALTAQPGRIAPDLNRRFQALALEYQRHDATANGWDLIGEASRVRLQAEEQAAASLPLQEGEFAVEYSFIHSPEQEWPGLNQEQRTLAIRRAELAVELFEQLGGTELLTQAAANPHALRPLGNTLETLIPDNLGELRQLARLSAARIALAQQGGRAKAAAESAEHLLAIGRIGFQQPLLLDHLVSVAIVTMACQRIREHAMDGLTPEQLQSIIEAVRRQRALMPPAALAVRAERLYGENFIQILHTDDGRGNGRLIPELAEMHGVSLQGSQIAGAEWVWEQLSEFGLVNLTSPLFASKRSVMRKHEEFFAALDAAAALPRWERSQVANPDAILEALSPRYEVLGGLHSVSMIVGFRDAVTASLEGTELLLAIELHRTRHGMLPQSLADVSSDILPQIPRDPYSGDPYVYRLEGESSRPGSGYLLYSTGADGQDNNGLQHPKGFDATHSWHGRGYDFVLNRRPLRGE